MSDTDRIFVTVTVTVTSSEYYSKQNPKVQESVEMNAPNDGGGFVSASVSTAARNLAGSMIEKAVYVYQEKLAELKKSNDASAQDDGEESEKAQ